METIKSWIELDLTRPFTVCELRAEIVVESFSVVWVGLGGVTGGEERDEVEERTVVGLIEEEEEIGDVEPTIDGGARSRNRSCTRRCRIYFKSCHCRSSSISGRFEFCASTIVRIRDQ